MVSSVFAINGICILFAFMYLGYIAYKFLKKNRSVNKVYK